MMLHRASRGSWRVGRRQRNAGWVDLATSYPYLSLVRTSTFRLAAIYVLIFALSVGAVLFYVYWSTANLLENQTDNAIGSEVKAIAEVYRQNGLPGVLEQIMLRTSEENHGVYIFTNPLGRRLAGNLPGLPVEATGEHGWIEFDYANQEGRSLAHHRAKAYYTELEGGFRLVVGRDVEERRRFDSIIKNSSIGGLTLALVLGLAGGLLMSRNFLKRIERLTATSRTIMAGDFSQRMPLTGTGDELDRLSAALNDMLDRIDRLMAGMREVSSNVAHDLKTPLTRIKVRAEDALRTGDERDYRMALERTIDESDKLLATFNALLSIAKAESGEAREGIAPIDAAELAADIAELYDPTIEEAGGRLTVKAPERTMISADRQLLAQALTNLLDNAIKYGLGPDGRPDVALSVSARHGEARIEVADHGPGIPVGDRERVKQRFTRLDESRTLPGSGLGLSLAESVAHLHGGRLELDDNHPGLVARLVLPAME
jgi:signal transduction histidine kinase